MYARSVREFGIQAFRLRFARRTFSGMRIAAAAGLATALMPIIAGCRTGQPVDMPASAPAITGKVVMFPGVSNLDRELVGAKRRISQLYPELECEVRCWGPLRRSLHNLRNEKGNLAEARIIAEELAEYARENPQHSIDLLGYSGGGAVALFVVAALPDDVSVRRVVLLAPAISRDYPLKETVLPKIKDFLVVFASPLDQPVTIGTRMFGTMDRKFAVSAGSRGFKADDPKLVQLFWRLRWLFVGHVGSHGSYVAEPWQRKYLLPVFAAEANAESLRRMR